MSRTMRHKHVMKEMLEDNYDLPKDNQKIVRVTSSRGNNLHEVESANDNERFLVSMPNKFRKNVWVKRGDFLIVDPIEEGDKVKAEISRILTPEHIKEFTKQGIWPKKFTKKRELSEDQDDDNHNEFPTYNVNRKRFETATEDDDDDTEEE